MTDTKLTPAQLKAELSQFIGTDGYHRVTFSPNLLVTDGVQHLCEQAGCYWLMELLASEPEAVPGILRRVRDGEDLYAMTFLTIESKGGKGTVRISVDSGVEPFFKKSIAYTDFPEGEWTLYLAAQDMGQRLCVIALLPSEY